MRVNISASVSCMLMLFTSSYVQRDAVAPQPTREALTTALTVNQLVIGLPASLLKAWYVTAHCSFAQLVTAQTELAVNRMWTTCYLTATLFTYWARVTWQFLQRNLCFPNFIF